MDSRPNKKYKSDRTVPRSTRFREGRRSREAELTKSETDSDSSSTLNQEMMVDISNFGISLDLNTQGNIANMEIEQTESSDETDSSSELDQHTLESREFANLQPCTDEYSVRFTENNVEQTEATMETTYSYIKWDYLRLAFIRKVVDDNISEDGEMDVS
ncbi:uncharacterized protein LOC127280428 [Leptopilina boulardi]|uniref:uncharacterized protein LOC127280428 n=1 Tax=Leptopilina boulardi TaxID=63433 RepID=UPI0021F54BF8|nr:uncharacterized protein LOC127280428 [Leptopilina boulardi]